MRVSLSPLRRSTVGFDDLASMLDRVADVNNEVYAYPPYNIERLTENDYRPSLVSPRVTSRSRSRRTHSRSEARGRTGGIRSSIAALRYPPSSAEVSGADMEGGLLSVDLKREIPDRLKPRVIEIGMAHQNGIKN